MGNYTRLYQIQDDVLAGVAVLAAKVPYFWDEVTNFLFR